MRNRTIILTASFLFFYAQYIYIPFQTAYLAALGATAAFIGTVTGAYGGTQFLLRLPVGLLADKIHRHKIFLVAGMAIAGAACGLRMCFPGLSGFLAASLLSGVSSSTWISFMVMHAECYGPKDQQKAAGRIIFAYNGGILGAFVTGTLLYERLGMRNICAFGAAAGAVGVLLCLQLKEERRAVSDNSVWELLAVCGNRRLLFFSLLALVQQGIQMATTMSFTAQILRGLGASERFLGISSIVYMISAVSASYGASLGLAEKKSSRFWIASVFTGVAVYCLLVPTCGRISVILCLQLIPGLASGLLFSILTAGAMEEVPEEKKSTAMGFYQAVYAIGMTVLPVITGNVSEGAGFSAAYVLLGGLAVLCVPAAFGFLRDKPLLRSKKKIVKKT